MKHAARKKWFNTIPKSKHSTIPRPRNRNRKPLIDEEAIRHDQSFSALYRIEFVEEKQLSPLDDFEHQISRTCADFGWIFASANSPEFWHWCLAACALVVVPIATCV